MPIAFGEYRGGLHRGAGVYLFLRHGFLPLMAGLAVSVLISTSFKNYPTSWKLAPVTVVILMVPPVMTNETLTDAMGIALNRTGEVLYGSLVAFLLGLLYVVLEKKGEKQAGEKFHE